MTWPEYQQLSAQHISLKKLVRNDAALNALRTTVIILLLVAIYLVGTHISLLPFINARKLHLIITQSTMLSAIDQLFTGGSLGILAPFTLGILPLLLFESGPATLVGSQLRNQFRLSRPALIVFVVGVALVMTWLVMSGIVPATLIDVMLTALYLIVGSGFLVFIDYQLTSKNGPRIIAINALIISINYASTLWFARHSIDLVTGVLILVFIASFALLVRSAKKVKITNIRHEVPRERELLIPATNGIMRIILLVCTFVVLAALTGILSIFGAQSLSPFGSSLPNVLLFIATLTGIVLAFMSNDLIDGLLSQFNGTATARTLMTNYWIVPGKSVGDATARTLTKSALESHRLNYAFYLTWAVLFSLTGLSAQLLRLPLTPLPFGPLGFIIILTLCSEIGYGLIYAVHRYLQIVRFGALWASPVSVMSNLQTLTEQHNLNELIQKFLPIATAEEQARLESILSSIQSGTIRFADILDLFKIVTQIRRRLLESQVEITLADVLLRLVICLLLSLLLIVCAVWLLQIFFLHDAFSDLAVREGAVIGWIGLFVGCAPFVSLDEAVKLFFSTLWRDPKRIALFRRPQKFEEDDVETFDVEREVLAYNYLLAKQRERLDVDRRAILAYSDMHERILAMMRTTVAEVVESHIPDESLADEQQLVLLLRDLSAWVTLTEATMLKLEGITSRGHIQEELQRLVTHSYEEQRKELDEHMAAIKIAYPQATTFTLRDQERAVFLRVIDTLWGRYVVDLEATRRRMLSRSNMRRDALTEFEQQIDNAFKQLLQGIAFDTVNQLLRMLRRGFSFNHPRPANAPPSTIIRYHQPVPEAPVLPAPSDQLEQPEARRSLENGNISDEAGDMKEVGGASTTPTTYTSPESSEIQESNP